MLEIYKGALPTEQIYQKLDLMAREKNLGANCIFVGVVRDEGGISGLSFDIYEPILKTWFEAWHMRIKKQDGIIYMAHSLGDVSCAQSSFMCAILSSKRKVALGFFSDFIEDFKHNAPIWKYDIKDNQRIYAKDRSNLLPHSGLLG